MAAIKCKRVYEKAEKNDGWRVLVDRLWPRGVKKEDASWDEWGKELAPSNELRKWFGHEPEKWQEFRLRYKAELKNNEAAADFIKAHKKKGTITLLYSAKDEAHNQALVLQEWLEKYL
jgi:uncharacterized protein YeaO (DUF488 family)